MSEAGSLAALLQAEAALRLGLAKPWEVAAALQAHWDAREGGCLDFAAVLGRFATLPDDAVSRLKVEAQRLLDAAGGDASKALTQAGAAGAALRSIVGGPPPDLARDPAQARHASHPLHTVSDDRYVEFHPVGEGGMGLVYWALDTEMNRQVAFKIVRPDVVGAHRAPTPETPLKAEPPSRNTPASAAFEELKARFLQEAWVTGGLEHPGVVPVYELGQTREGVPYYTMRFVRGSKTFRQALDAVRSKPVEERLALLEPFLKLCDTVRYAHSKGVIHRDLKPENVALGEFGEVVLLDWGLAKVQGRDDRAASRWRAGVQEHRHAADLKTLAGPMGTAGYLSPEAAQGRAADVDERSDVYSLGAILYEILSGRLPFEFRSYGEYLEQVVEGDPPDPRTLAAGVPAALADLCLQALARDPASRMGDAGTLAQALRRWQAASALDREVDGLLRDARASLEAAAASTGEMRLAHAERVAAALAQVDAKRPGLPASHALHGRLRALQEEGVRQRERASRRRLLWRLGVAALAFTAALAAIVSAVIERKRREAEEARAVAQDRLLASYEDRGRIELLADRPMRALPLLIAAMSQGRDTPELRTLIGMAQRSRAKQAASIDLSSVPGNLAGHANSPACEMSGDGRLLSTRIEGQVTVWRTGDDRALWTSAGVVMSAIHPGSEFVACVDTQGQLTLRDSTTGAVFETLPSAGCELLSLVVSANGDRLAGRCNAGGGVLWKRGAQPAPRSVTVPDGSIQSLFLGPDAGALLLLTSAGQVVVWDVATSATRRAIPLPVGSVPFVPYGLRLRWDRTGTQILLDGRLCSVWDAESGVRVGPPATTWSGALSPDGRFVLTPEGVHVVVTGKQLWQARTGTSGHGYPEELGWSPAGDVVACADASGVIRLWDASRGWLLTELHGHEAILEFVGWSEDGGTLATRGRDGTLRAWVPGALPTTERLQTPAEGFCALGFADEGRQMLGATSSGWLYRWQVGTWEPTRSAIASGPVPRRAALSPDGRWLATWGDDGIHATALDGSEVRRLLHKPEAAQVKPRSDKTCGGAPAPGAAPGNDGLPPDPDEDQLGFLSQGRWLLTSSYRECRTWDARTWLQRGHLQGRLLAVRDVTSSSGSTCLGVLATPDRGTVVAELPEGGVLSSVPLTDVRAADVSPDGTLLAVVRVGEGAARSTRGTGWILLLDAHSARQVRELETGVPDVDAVHFSSDGRTVVAQSARRVLVGLDVLTGRRLYTVVPPSDYCSSVEIVADRSGRFLASWPGNALELRGVRGGALLAAWLPWCYDGDGSGALAEATLVSPDGEWLVRYVGPPQRALLQIWQMGAAQGSPSEIQGRADRGANWGLEGDALDPLRVPPIAPCGR